MVNAFDIACYIQRSFRSEFSPNELLTQVDLSAMMRGSVAIRDKAFDVNRKDSYSDSPYQKGRFTYRTTIAVPRNAVWDIKILYPKGKEGLSWGDPNNVEIIDFKDFAKAGAYCGLLIPEDCVPDIKRYAVIFGGEYWTPQKMLTPVFCGEEIALHVTELTAAPEGRPRKEFY